ncbi:MAG: cardiolipin synthase [Gammaproteobacteria bacterium]|nr:cardiolipin synthase [Gammaproteobacteria bacterium]
MHFAFIFGVLLTVLAVAHVFRQRRSPSSTIAWLLVIFTFPYLGIPLYILLGGRKMKRIARAKGKIHLIESHVPPLKEAGFIDRALRASGIPAAMKGNHMRLCLSGEDAYAALTELIEGASESLYISTFIFAQDEVGRDILKRLARKAAKGVTVRLLMDGVGSLHTRRRFLKPLLKAGGRYAFFMPVLHKPFRGRTNLRNHRKIAVADECRAMAGGTNIGVEYIGSVPHTGRWHDLSFVIDGPAAMRYAELFQTDWEFASGEHVELHLECLQFEKNTNGSAILQVVPSGPDVPKDTLYETILSATFTAKKRFWIVTPYFVPDDALVQGLVIAAHRGVDVRIIVPEKSDHRLADMVRGSYLREVQEAGAQVLFFTGGMVHAKVLLMDDEFAMIGSANMDMRSLFLNYEVATFAYTPAEIAATKAWIEKLLRETYTDIIKTSPIRDLYEGVSRMIAPLM